MSTRAARERRLVTGLCVSLGALAATIGGLMYAERKQTAESTYASFTPDTTRRITIERPDRQDIVLERAPDVAQAAASTDAGWQIVAPCAINANNARVDPLLDALTSRSVDYAADEVDLDAAGLVAPLATIRLDATTIRLGDTDVTGERRYAMTNNRVALVPEWVLSLVDGGLSALGDPVAFPIAPARLHRVDDTLADGADESSDQKADPPLRKALDPSLWAGLAASQIIAWPMPDSPPVSRRARLEVVPATGETHTLDLLGTASWNALLSADGNCARLFSDTELPPDSYR